VKNLQFSDTLVNAIARGDKDVTRRLLSGDPATAKPRYVPGDVCYVGEALTKDALGMALYRRDGADVHIPNGDAIMWRWQRDVLPARFCPEACARLFLDVVSVRAERLRTIDYDEIRREGVVAEWIRLTGAAEDSPVSAIDGVCYADMRSLWVAGWDSINGERAPWASNPWVWRVEFRRLASRAEAEEMHRERKRKGRAA
jgi:hypothetical protein